VAWNSPSDLSLGKLGHIAAGNGDSTSETSLNDCGRDSGTGETAMWGDFKPGTGVYILNTNDPADGSARVYFSIRVRNDVGTYMGGETLFTHSLMSSVGDGGFSGYLFNLVEPNAGSLYGSRIAANSDNSADYNGEFTVNSGSAGFAISQLTPMDSFKFWNP